jgi:hypothetical protein
LTFFNTGKAIGRLAIIFITDPRSGDTNWLATHSNAAVDSTLGCRVDASLPGIVCGPLGAGKSFDLHLSGTASTRGAFVYEVKFADVSAGAPGPNTYIDENPDGTHQTLAWQEIIT